MSHAKSLIAQLKSVDLHLNPDAPIRYRLRINYAERYQIIEDEEENPSNALDVAKLILVAGVFIGALLGAIIASEAGL